MKHGNRIITFFLAVAIAFACCLPAVITPAHAAAPAAAFDQVGSDASITLNNGDVLRVPSEAITGNYIVYRVNYGVYRYYVIDVFESTDGVKEMAFLSFTRYVGQQAITNANALSPNVWTIYGMQNVLYAISGALTVRPMYSTFDYYDAFGFLLIGGVGTDHTEDEFAGTFEVSTLDYTFTLPREIMGEQFMIINNPASTSLDTIQVLVFPNLEKNYITEGDILSYNKHYISDFDTTIMVSVVVNSMANSYPLVSHASFNFSLYPYWYAVQAGNNVVYFYCNKSPVYCDGSSTAKSDSTNYCRSICTFQMNDLEFDVGYKALTSSTLSFDASQLVWSNADIYDVSTGDLVWSVGESNIHSTNRVWTFDALTDRIMALEQDGTTILYSSFDYYGADGSLYYGNSFAGEVTEDDSLIDLTLDDGTLIRVPEHFGERDARYVVIDPVGGTEETAYLIYEFDYYEGVADGTVCDFTRWYGVFSDGVWSWNYQEYYVTELDILDYGPIVYSTFEYVDGRVDEEEPPGSGGATSEEVKGFWDKLMAKLEEILKAIKGIGGTDLSISIENNTIIDAADKDPFDPEVYKGVVKTLRNSVKLFTGFFGFIYDGVNNFIDFLTDTSSEFYGIFHVNGMG